MHAEVLSHRIGELLQEVLRAPWSGWSPRFGNRTITDCGSQLLLAHSIPILLGPPEVGHQQTATRFMVDYQENPLYVYVDGLVRIPSKLKAEQFAFIARTVKDDRCLVGWLITAGQRRGAFRFADEIEVQP